MVASDRSRLTLRLSVPYATRWGQMVRVIGAGAAFGDGDVEAAPELACRHAGDRLLWSGEVTVPRAASYTYKYVVVGEGGNVEDEELSDRELQVPAGIAAGAVIDVRDEWQARRGHVSAAFCHCCTRALITSGQSRSARAAASTEFERSLVPHSCVAAERQAIGMPISDADRQRDDREGLTSCIGVSVNCVHFAAEHGEPEFRLVTERLLGGDPCRPNRGAGAGAASARGRRRRRGRAAPPRVVSQPTLWGLWGSTPSSGRLPCYLRCACLPVMHRCQDAKDMAP